MDKINKNLVIFCHSISKNDDYFFLINEIRLSRNFFKKITIVPFKKNLTELDAFKYENVYIDNSLSKSFEHVINIFIIDVPQKTHQNIFEQCPLLSQNLFLCYVIHTPICILFH